MIPPNSIAWLFWLGVAISGGGLALVFWRFAGDRFRHLRTPVPRRCARCGYDMESVEGLRCPECGREGKSERSLHRARVRWKSGLVALLLITPIGLALAAHRPLFDRPWQTHLPERALLWATPGDLTFERVSGKNADGDYVSNDLYHGTSTELGRRATNELFHRWEFGRLGLRGQRRLIDRLLRSRDPVELRFRPAAEGRGPLLLIDPPGYAMFGARLPNWKPSVVRSRTIRVRPNLDGAEEFAALLTGVASAYALDLPTEAAPPFECIVILEDRGVELWRGTMTVAPND